MPERNYDTPDGLPPQVCGRLGCRAEGRYVVEHPEHGERTVCADHAAKFDTIRTLDGEEEVELIEVSHEFPAELVDTLLDDFHPSELRDILRQTYRDIANDDLPEDFDRGD